MKTSHLLILVASCLVVLQAVDAVPVSVHDQCLSFCHSVRAKTCGGLSDEETSSCIREFTSSCMKSCLNGQFHPMAIQAGPNSLDCTCTNGRTVSFCIRACPPATLLDTLCTPVCSVFGGLGTSACAQSTDCQTPDHL